MNFNFTGSGFAKKDGFSLGGGKQTANPLDAVDQSGTVEEVSGREFQAMESAYVQRAKKEAERKKNATDGEFWFAVYFESRAEKEAFLKAIGAKKNFHGDKYLSGRDLAKLLNVDY